MKQREGQVDNTVYVLHACPVSFAAQAEPIHLQFAFKEYEQRWEEQRRTGSRE